MESIIIHKGCVPMTIRELRKEKNLTQAEFARSIGIGVSTVPS